MQKKLLPQGISKYNHKKPSVEGVKVGTININMIG
jgi:hypothetical protein